MAVRARELTNFGRLTDEPEDSHPRYWFSAGLPGHVHPGKGELRTASVFAAATAPPLRAISLMEAEAGLRRRPLNLHAARQRKAQLDLQAKVEE